MPVSLLPFVVIPFCPHPSLSLWSLLSTHGVLVRCAAHFEGYGMQETANMVLSRPPSRPVMMHRIWMRSVEFVRRCSSQSWLASCKQSPGSHHSSSYLDVSTGSAARVHYYCLRLLLASGVYRRWHGEGLNGATHHQNSWEPNYRYSASSVPGRYRKGGRDSSAMIFYGVRAGGCVCRIECLRQIGVMGGK